MLTKFSKHRPAVKLPIHIPSRRIYVVPTKFGIFFGILLLIMLLGSLNYNNNMALMMTFLLSGFMLLIPIYTVRNLSGLEVLHVNASPVFAGEPAQFVVTLRNRFKTARPMLWGRHTGTTSLVGISAESTAELAIEIDTSARGWMAFKRSQLYTTYPVGLFYAWAWLIPDVRCLVYPRPEKNAPQIPIGSHDSTGQPERKGDEEWAGLREYAPGDPSRLLAWKVVARTDELTSKVFSDHQNQEVTLDYDQIEGGDVEMRLSRLCAWVLKASGDKLHYSLKLPGQVIPMGHGDQHQHTCLLALAEFKAAG